MGNILITDGVLKDNTPLGKYIHDFAIENYKFSNKNQYNQTMKKRACCRNVPIVPIALPSYDPTTKKIYPTKVNIKVFKSQNDINEDNCTIDGQNYAPQSKGDQSGKGFVAATVCSSFYDNLCNDLYNARKSSYTKPIDQLYGPYSDDPVDGTNDENMRDLHVGNAYTDCNCLNGIFKRGTNLSTSRTGENVPQTITKDQLQKILDPRCADYLPFNGPFVKQWNQPDSIDICINSINLGNVTISAENSSNTIKQSCTANQTRNNTNISNTGPTKTIAEEKSSSSAGITDSIPVPSDSISTSSTTTIPASTSSTSIIDTTNNNKSNNNKTSNSETSNISEESKNNNTLIYVGVGILFLIIILFMISKNNNYYYDNYDDR